MDASTFTLRIKLGNAAMQTPADIADALRHVAMTLDAREVAGYEHAAAQPARRAIRDENGATVGEWVTE